MAILVFVFVLGLCVGSFLNVLIYRLPRNLPLTGRSFCPKCRKKISWYDNIPLLSFLLLKGRCRACHSPISFQYPLVELATGTLFVIAFLFFPWQNYELRFMIYDLGGWLLLVYGFWLVSALVAIFVIDLKHQIIPDQLIYPTAVFSVLFEFINRYSSVINHLLSAFGAGFFFLLLHLFTRGRGMGFGDVKLSVLMGLILGFPKAILAFYIAFLTGAFWGVILILAGKKKFGQQVPFGPFLVGSAVIALFWGEVILRWITVHLF